MHNRDLLKNTRYYLSRLQTQMFTVRNKSVYVNRKIITRKIL